MNSNHDNQLPADLRAIEQALDRLAAAERAAAPAGLEDRIAAATAGQLGAPAPLPITIARRSRVVLHLRMAAVVALAASLGLFFAGRSLLRTSAPSPSNGVIATAALEQDVELWLALHGGDEFQDVSERLDLLAVDTETIGEPSSDWTSLLDPGSL